MARHPIDGFLGSGSIRSRIYKAWRLALEDDGPELLEVEGFAGIMTTGRWIMAFLQVTISVILLFWNPSRPIGAYIAMALLILLGRPFALMLDSLVRNNAVVPGVTSLIRWQSHWHVVRQSWPFFQNDFAGRIANRVMQTSNAVRESVVSSIRAVWYIVAYGISALVLMGLADWRLAVPTALWFAGYVVFLRHFVPRLRDLSRTSASERSRLMARVVQLCSCDPRRYKHCNNCLPGMLGKDKRTRRCARLTEDADPDRPCGKPQRDRRLRGDRDADRPRE